MSSISNDLISIIIPVYNAERTLRACVESVLAQTYTHLEIILVDDGSVPACAGLCDALAGKDGRIRVLHQENRGVSAARNHGLEKCNGRWIQFVDADDLLHPECCEHALSFCKRNGTEAVLFRYRRISDEKGTQDHARRGRTSFSVDKSRILTYEETMMSLLDNRIGNFSWNRMCAAGLYEGIRFPSGRLYEDVGTIWKVMEHAQCVGFLNEVLYDYRQSAGSISRITGSKALSDEFLMREELWNHVTGKAPKAANGNEFFILAPALKYCMYLSPEEDQAVYQRAEKLIRTAHEVPEAFGFKQKNMMRLLRCMPKLFQAVCKVLCRRTGFSEKQRKY